MRTGFIGTVLLLSRLSSVSRKGHSVNCKNEIVKQSISYKQDIYRLRIKTAQIHTGTCGFHKKATVVDRHLPIISFAIYHDISTFITLSCEIY